MRFLLEDSPPGPNDLPDERTIYLSNGKTIKALREGQYGFWKVKYDHGMVSPSLLGTFTTFDKAKQEIKLYFQKKNIQIVDEPLDKEEEVSG